MRRIVWVAMMVLVADLAFAGEWVEVRKGKWEFVATPDEQARGIKVQPRASGPDGKIPGPELWNKIGDNKWMVRNPGPNKIHGSSSQRWYYKGDGWWEVTDLRGDLMKRTGPDNWTDRGNGRWRVTDPITGRVKQEVRSGDDERKR